jgi:hypothetical protein
MIVRPHLLALAPCLLVLACVDADRENAVWGNGEGGGATSDGSGDGGDGNGDEGGGDDGDDEDDGNDDGSLFDVAPGTGGPGDVEDGCEKVDFLFIVDNSTSMSDDQANLTGSFPGFIQTIQDTINAQDYQIMVVDSDEWVGGGASNLDIDCSPAPSCCLNCAPPATCNGGPCLGPPPPPPAPDPPPSPCDPMLGSGRTLDMYWEPCGIAGDQRYMVDGQPDIEATFSCVATAGQWGDSGERMMEAMVNSVGPGMQGAGGCNEGFIRDDAILVVTFITDEPDKESAGDPASWRQALVDAKNGNEDAIVVLGLIRDGDNTPEDACNNYAGPFGGAGSAPLLSELIHSFGDHGIQGSVCELDYTPFFIDAVSTIDIVCDEFQPEG